MNRVQLAIERIQFVRQYTLTLLTDLKPEDWFRMPAEGVTHIAWQVGHIAIAEYAMTMRYIRGRQPGDEDFIPREFVSLFGKGSVVDSDAARHPSPDEIRKALDRIHERVPIELANLSDAELDQPPTSPHPAFSTKLAALFFCGEHEMVHAGQIGLVRRLLGYAPVR